MLKKQVERAAELGYVALAGTELEFIVFEDTYEQAWNLGYRGLTPSNQYNVDYSIVGTTRVEPLLRDIRNTMYAAGTNVEAAKGECNLGQHEIGFLFDEVVATADNHAVYKTVAKEIASLHGKSITFMAKINEREGSSCHIHLSLRGADGEVVFWDKEKGGRTPLYDSFVAGVLATMADFTLLYAPNVNSYKRFAEGSFAPTAIGWGEDNRTCAVRLVGHGAGARMENRVPGGDVNPYLALAAMMAGGLYGVENELELEPPTEGNAYASDKPKVPQTLHEAREVFAQLGDRPCDPWRRRRGPLHEHGRRRAEGLPGLRHRLGAAARLRAAVTHASSSPHRREEGIHVHPHRPQPCHRPAGDRGRAGHRRGDRRADPAGRMTPFRPGATSRRGSAPGCCAGSPPWSTSTSTSSRTSRSATPATPWATPAGRRATSATASTTTPRRRSGSSGGRSRCPAAST